MEFAILSINRVYKETFQHPASGLHYKLSRAHKRLSAMVVLMPTVLPCHPTAKASPVLTARKGEGEKLSAGNINGLV